MPNDNHYCESAEEAEKRIHRGEKEYTSEQEDLDMEEYYENQ